MDNIEKQFEDFIDDIRFDDVPSSGHRDKLERNILAVLTAPSRQTGQSLRIWRTLMKTKITKFATAAVITVTLILSIVIFNQSAAPAWAIEQSIKALDPFRAVSIEGWESEQTWIENGSLELRPFKSWAVANEDRTMVEKYRTEVEDYLTLTTNGQKTWRYDPNTHTVRIENRPYNAGDYWCGSHFLQQLKKGHESGFLTRWEVTYDKDTTTGRPRIILKIAWLDERYNGPRSLRLEFDMESKLLVALKQWENSNWDGPATLIAEKITCYKNLPDELFEFKVPEGATVIEK
jgi:outer membrane lipoprotein-sorting protein